MSHSSVARKRMVERQLVPRGIHDPRVLAAMGKVAREAFLPASLHEFAYDDTPLPIAAGQTISQPYVVALMAQAAAPAPGDRVLEIGTGSGYAAAVLAELAGRLDSIERLDELAYRAAGNLRAQGYGDVTVHIADGTLGWPANAPYDVIVAAASAPDVPTAWREQLAVGGRLVMPVGGLHANQRLVRITRLNHYEYAEEDLGGVSFVPLIGQQGWPVNDILAQMAIVGEPPARANVAGPGDPAGEPASAAPGGSAPAPAPPLAPLHALMRRANAQDEAGAAALADAIWDQALPLPALDDPAFGALFDRYADKRVVVLGGALSGSAEACLARVAITRRLVEMHGYDCVAVSADWRDGAQADARVRQLPAEPAEHHDRPWRHFPGPLWQTRQFQALLDSLRAYNCSLAPAQRVVFCGLDRYDSAAAIASVLGMLGQAGAETAALRERYGCLQPWQRDPEVYARAIGDAETLQYAPEVVAQLRAELAQSLAAEPGPVAALRDEASSAEAGGGEASGGETGGGETGGADASGGRENAGGVDAGLGPGAANQLLDSADAYYTALFAGTLDRAALRTTAMFATLEDLLRTRGPQARCVVWAEDTDAGDACASDIGRVHGLASLGQLCRERYGDQAVLIGFGSHGGEVLAADRWDGPIRPHTLAPARAGSLEKLLHLTGQPRFYLDLAGIAGDLQTALERPRPQRLSGPVYRQEADQRSHYSEASLAHQYDGYVWFDETTAAAPMPPSPHGGRASPPPHP